jgi:hypothetical protein
MQKQRISHAKITRMSRSSETRQPGRQTDVQLICRHGKQGTSRLSLVYSSVPSLLSLEIYSYDSSGKATTILQMQEHNPSDLARQDQPIPQVAPQ